MLAVNPFPIKHYLFFVLLVIIGNKFSAQTDVIEDAYSDKISYNPCDTALLYINAKNNIANATLYIFSQGNIKVDSIISNIMPQNSNSQDPSVTGFNYSVTTKYKIPNLKSGIYNIDHKIFFVIKNPTRNAAITIVYPSNTNNAYNDAGGKSLYGYGSVHATTVSFLRPFTMMLEASGFMDWSYNLNYDIQWICDMDLDDYDSFKESKLLIIIGHSEYWTRQARLNYDAFVDNNKNALILSGNTMWWQVRYTPDKKGMICYKTAYDPIADPLLKTINWNHLSLKYPIINSIGEDWVYGGFGNNPENQYINKAYKVYTPSSPILQNTGKTFGQFISCNTHEHDGVPTLGYRDDQSPIIDTFTLNFCRIELVAFDGASNVNSSIRGNGSIIVFKKTPTSGITINTASNTWCSIASGMYGPDSIICRQITSNAIDKLLNGESIFSYVTSSCPSQQKNNAMIQVFPNPNNGKFTLQLKQEKDQICCNLRVTITDVLGNTVYQSPPVANESLTVYLPDQSKGIYFVQMYDPNSLIGATKIVIQ